MKKIYAMLMLSFVCHMPVFAFDMTSMATNTAMTMMVIGALDSDSDSKKPANVSAKEIKESSKTTEKATNAPDWLLYTIVSIPFIVLAVLVGILLCTAGMVIKEEYFPKKA